MDKGEKSAENDKSAEIGAKIKDEPQEETIKVGVWVIFSLFL